MEVTVRSAHDDLVAWLEGEDVAGGYTRIDIHESHLGFGFERRSGDSDGEHEAVPFGGIVGHGVGAYSRFRVDTLEIEESEFFPCGEIFLSDGGFVDILVVVDGEGGNLYLGVGTGDEVHVFSLRQGHDEFLDEGGYVLVRHYRTFVFLDVENRCGHLDVKIVLDLYLTGQAPVVLDFLAGEMHGLGRQDFTSAGGDLYLALAAAAFASAGRGEEHVPGCHGRQQWLTGRYLYFLVPVDGDGDIARADQIFLGY